MNLFRSEEHAQNWKGFAEAGEKGLISMSDLLTLFSIPYFAAKLDKDYFSRLGDYRMGMVGALKEIGKRNPYWQPQKPK